MKVKITQKHIEEGSRGDPYKCPVALALQECGLFDMPCVIGRYAIERAWGKAWSGLRRYLPKTAFLWIVKFDEGGIGEEFEFEFDRTFGAAISTD